jgi:hypothetical protein
MADAKVGHELKEINIEILDGPTFDAFCPLIRDLHITCIKDGALLGFLESAATPESVMLFWTKMSSDVISENIYFAIATAGDGTSVIGVVYLIHDQATNGRHRGDICKLMVHPQ